MPWKVSNPAPLGLQCSLSSGLKVVSTSALGSVYAAVDLTSCISGTPGGERLPPSAQEWL